MDVRFGQAGQGTKIWVYIGNETKAQKFKLNLL